MIEVMETLCITLVDPTEGNAVGDDAFAFDALCDMTIVGVSVAPAADDADATLDINDDGSGVITAVDASDADVPGVWSASGFGGTNDPVKVDAGSLVTFDINSGAAGTAFFVVIRYLAGLAST